MSYMIRNVEALYPRVNKTYRFDNVENRSVPCDPLDDGATYSTSFRMNEDQAKELMGAMAKAYVEKRQSSWPEKIPMPFKKDDDGMFVGKATLKGAYGKDVTSKPRHFDAGNKELPDDFQLTSRSTVNLAVVLVPYNMREQGVSLRLRAVQVIKYVPMEAASPFDVVDGFTSDDDNPFAELEAVVEVAVVEEVELSVEEEAIEEPKKKTAKVKTAPAPVDKEGLSDLIDGWDDES